jgi:hypothetical protein
LGSHLRGSTELALAQQATGPARTFTGADRFNLEHASDPQISPATAAAILAWFDRYRTRGPRAPDIATTA